MSQDLYICLLDLNEFRKIQGSGDRGLLADIISRQEGEIASIDSFFAKEPGYVPLAEVIERIIEGNVDDDSIAVFEYEEAAAMIAEAVGDPLDCDLVREAKEALFEEVDQVIRRLRRSARISKSVWLTFQEILERGPLLQIPLDEPGMRVGTGYLTEAEVGDAFEALKKVDIEGSVPEEGLTWPEEATDIVSAYAEWLEEAATKKVGLYFHR